MIGARSVSLLRIIEPLASHSIAAARYLDRQLVQIQFDRHYSEQARREGLSVVQDRLRRVRYLCHFNPHFPPGTLTTQLDDGHTATVLITHELRTHRRPESSLNARATTDLHVRPSLADRFCFP